MKTIFSWYKSAYSGLPGSAWMMAAIHLVNASGTMVLAFLTLYLSQTRGFSESEAGSAVGAYGIGMIIGTTLGGTLSDRFGPFQVQKLSLLASTIFLFILSFSNSFVLIYALIVLWGVFSSALFPANAAAMAQLCPERVRIKGFVVNRLVNNLGASIGPAIGGFLALFNFRLLFWVDGITCFLAAIGLIIYFPSRNFPAIQPVRTLKSNDGFRWKSDETFVKILMATVATGMIISQIFGTLGLYLKTSCSFSEPQIGLLLALNTILIVIFQMPLTHFVEKYSRSMVASVGATLLAVGFGMMPARKSLLFAAVTIVVWTIGEMLTLPSLVAMVSSRAPSGAQGKYQGLYGMAFSIGMIAGPTLGSRIYVVGGGAALWESVAVIGLISSVLFLSVNKTWNSQKSTLIVGELGT